MALHELSTVNEALHAREELGETLDESETPQYTEPGSEVENPLHACWEVARKIAVDFQRTNAYEEKDFLDLTTFISLLDVDGASPEEMRSHIEQITLMLPRALRHFIQPMLDNYKLTETLDRAQEG